MEVEERREGEEAEEEDSQGLLAEGLSVAVERRENGNAGWDWGVRLVGWRGGSE